jgi:hypothetical protein
VKEGLFKFIHILFCIVLCDSFSIYSTPYSTLFGTTGVSVSQWPVVRVYITYMKPVYIHHIKKLMVSYTGIFSEKQITECLGIKSAGWRWYIVLIRL